MVQLHRGFVSRSEEAMTVRYTFDRCPQCTGPILNWEDEPKQELCNECQTFARCDNDEKAPHPRMIQCPYCNAFEVVQNTDDHEIYEEGNHSICCPNCNEDYEIKTEIKYVFWSLKKGR
jgi:uncharacterized protein YbaR (Trm112 family)